MHILLRFRRIPHGFLSHALRHEAALSSGLSHPVVTNDACRSKKLSATRQVELPFLIDEKRNQQYISDFMSHPLE